jgi:hypothetical protein
MGLVGTKKVKESKKDKYALPQNGHYILICKECGEIIHIPAHIEHQGLVCDFDPKKIRLTCDFDGQYTNILDGMGWFFNVGVSEPENQILYAGLKDNMQLIHQHISLHHDVFYLMISQGISDCYYGYAKNKPNDCLTYRNGQVEGLDKLLKTIYMNGRRFDLSKAEIPGVSWPVEAAAAPQEAAPQISPDRNGNVDLAEFSAKERKLMDAALTFMVNLALTGGIANGEQIAADCAKVSTMLSSFPATIGKGEHYLTAGDFAKVGFSVSSYRQAIPQLVEVNPQYRAHKNELMQDYSFYMPDLILKMTQYMEK